MHEKCIKMSTDMSSIYNMSGSGILDTCEGTKTKISLFSKYLHYSFLFKYYNRYVKEIVVSIVNVCYVKPLMKAV